MTLSNLDATVLVTGATGKQGGAVAKALFALNVPVRALVRDVETPAARRLAALGAELVPGDLEDGDTLFDACKGVRAVFSVQTPFSTGFDGERRQGENLLRAALQAQVPQFVHSSVSGAGAHHRSAPGWAEGRWSTEYWETKAHMEDLVQRAGFRYWFIIKPAFFMENFIRPSAFFRDQTSNRFLTIMAPDTELPLIAAQDIGIAAAGAVADPNKFHGISLELAGQFLTMTQIARILSEAWDEKIEAPILSLSEALAEGLMPEMVSSQQRMNEVSSPADPRDARSLGLPITDLETWAAMNKPR